MECEFCKATLKTLSSLNYHKKTNKKCLSIQKNKVENVQSNLIECEHCKKTFLPFNYVKHINSCNQKMKNLEEKIKLLEQETQNQRIIINSLEEKLKLQTSLYEKDRDIINEIARQPKNNTNNNTIYNLSDFNRQVIQERFANALEDTTKNSFYDGQIAVARIIVPCVKEDNMVKCSDYSRNIFVRKENGEIKRDPDAKDLATLIQPLASKKANEINNIQQKQVAKVQRLKFLMNDISRKENELKFYKENVRLFKPDSIDFLNYSDSIRYLEPTIEEYIKEKEELENEGIRFDQRDIHDIELHEGVIDIMNLDVDSTKFATELKKHLYE